MALTKVKFLFLDILLLIVIIGLVKITFDLHKYLFIAEFLFLVLVILAALISMVLVYNDIDFGWNIISVMMVLILLDLLVLYMIRKPKFILLWPTALLSFLGFLLSLVFIKTGNEVSPEESKMPINKKGNFVASSMGKKYHNPNCDWAKKIKNNNAVWFDTKESAEKKGYKADNCVE